MRVGTEEEERRDDGGRHVFCGGGGGGGDSGDIGVACTCTYIYLVGRGGVRKRDGRKGKTGGKERWEGR